MDGTHSLHSIGDSMKKKASILLEDNSIVPVTIFSTTDASDLQTGYSDMTLFDLDVIVIYKEGTYHAFNDHFVSKSYVLQKAWIKPHPMRDFPSFIEGVTLAGYDLERFVLPILSNYFEELGHKDHIDVLKFAHDRSGMRFSLFNLAFWNRCDNISTVSEFFTFHRVRMIADWFNGTYKNIIKRLQTETKWIGQLVYRIKKHKTLLVKDEQGKKIKIFAQDEEE
jgi:hypothetical protein